MNTDCNFNEDRISALPDAILISILSLLPVMDAVNTILIRKFNHLWPFIYSLTFHQCMFPGHNCFYYTQSTGPNYDERFLNFVRHVFLLNKSPTIHKFGLTFHFSLPHSIRQPVDIWQYECMLKEQRVANEIGTWIQYAINRNVKVLELSFSAHGTLDPLAYYDLPNFVLSSPHLVELRLAYCKVNTKKKSELKSLTTLSLYNVLLIDESMDYILSGCPMIEELTLWYCYGLKRLILVNSSLKTLVLGIRWSGTRIHVSCPTLISFKMYGTVEVLDITNASSVAEASVTHLEKFDLKLYNPYLEMRVLLQAVTGAKCLKLCSWFALVFSLWEFANLPSPTFTCKTLRLQLDFVKWHLPGILNLLRHCPCLENLTIEITADYGYPTRKLNTWIQQYDFDEDEFWELIDPIECLTEHLKSVEISGTFIDKNVIQFLEYLLSSCMSLETMVIYPEELMWVYGKLCWLSTDVDFLKDKLENAPKASPGAKVIFANRKTLERICI